MREKEYLYSMIGSLLSQFITVICGIILPRVLIKTYGSELYGATTSITQFLGYIALLEGGIGGVARAALYKPLAEKNDIEISKIMVCIQRFFRWIAIIFAFYVILIACSYKFIAKDSTLTWKYAFSLVIVIALSSMAQYYYGIAYSVLLQADQKVYIISILGAMTTLINTLVACTMALMGADMILLKLAWCGVHFLRIGILKYYISKKYRLQKIKTREDYLPQKWDGLGQHIAYFLHSHTDIVVLTFLINLTEVSIYSVYNYIFTSLNVLIAAVSANMEALFGDMLAKKEKYLYMFFNHMDFLVNTVSIVCYSVAYNLVIPFVMLYTAGINDADYIRPKLAVLMILTQMVCCLRQPYHQLIIAAGRFKETKWAAYIEALMNISLSIIMAIAWRAEEVVLATFLSIIFRMGYYIVYLNKHILKRSFYLSAKRIIITIINMTINISVSKEILFYIKVQIDTMARWLIAAVLLFTVNTFLTVIFSYLFYRSEMKYFFDRVSRFMGGKK